MNALTTIDADRWVRVPASWGAYQRLLKARGERRRPRYIYLERELTIVSPGHSHESLSAALVGLIQEILVGLSIGCHASGQVTLKKAARSREGAEADATFYLTNIDRVRGKRELVMGDDPPPDFVVEVIVSRPEQDALEAYRRFGIREVWICRESGLEFLLLGDDGRYASSPASRCLPFVRSEEIAPWVFRDDLANNTQVLAGFRAWVAGTLAPRVRPEG